MNIHPYASFRRYAVLLLGWVATTGLKAQTVSQSITLTPGWNSVWLEVRPDENSTASVFANLPLSSVWTRLERRSATDFIQSVSEEAFNKAGWQHWFPATREESILNNLFAVQANHAYLIKLDGTLPVVWTVTGRPSLRRPEWVPDAFTLRGAPVDPVQAVTFLEFFRASPAHYKPSGNILQPIYRLDNAKGEWVQVNPGDLMKSGEAYWIYSEGASDFLAPIEARVETGDGLDFGTVSTSLNLTLENRKTTPVNAIVESSAGVGGVSLVYDQLDPEQGLQWPSLPASLAMPLDSGGTTRVRLAPRRSKQTAESAEAVIKVRDGAGVRLLIPASIQRTGLPSSGDSPMTGLWVGNATIKAVSEAHSADDSITPTPTKSEFSLRVIIHVDAAGQARLLKDVIQMWKDGTYTTNGNGDKVVDQPGEYVLITDDSLIPQFKGSAVRDGESVGRRISTIGYDFATTNADKSLDLSGALATGNSLAGTLTLPSDHATNPFKHKYHPDHDNLNADFDGPAEEAYAVTRQIVFQFAASPPDGLAVPDFGYNEMGGSYREILTGIHKNAIHLDGTFRLSRVSTVAELNPTP